MRKSRVFGDPPLENSNLKTLSKITGDRLQATLPRSTHECFRIYFMVYLKKKINIHFIELWMERIASKLIYNVLSIK